MTRENVHENPDDKFRILDRVITVPIDVFYIENEDVFCASENAVASSASVVESAELFIITMNAFIHRLIFPN